MIRPPPTSTLFPYPTLFRSVPPAVDEDLQVREDLEITDAPRLDPTGIQSGRQVSLGRAPRADQPAAGGPFDRVRSEEHTSELQSPDHLLSRLPLEKNNHP